MGHRRVLLAALVLYATAFVVWWPNDVVVVDEARYVGQASLFAHGHVRARQWSDSLHAVVEQPASDYPPGTSLVQTPFVAVGGPQAAQLASLLSLVVMVLCLAALLREVGRPELFALVPLLYPPTLVLGRVGMSDVPSGAIVAIGWLMFWRGLRGARRDVWWTAAGFLAGASLLWRESNPLAFAPLFLGVVVRRDRGAAALFAGGAAGVAVRLAASAWIFGDPFYHRGFLFAPPHVVSTLALYAFALTVMIPAGLFGLLGYRGARRPEVIATGLLFLFFYSAYYYDGGAGSLALRVILGPRFFIPVVPVFAFAMAETFPRWYALAPSWLRHPTVRRVAAAALACLLVVALVAPHVVLHRKAREDARMRDALLRITGEGALIVFNPESGGTLAWAAPGRRIFVGRDHATSDDIRSWSRRGDGIALAMVDRRDAAWRAREADVNARYEAQIVRACQTQVLFDTTLSAVERFRLLRVRRCESGSALAALDSIR
jgi:4-amino-4-deoxy-L-arabinose transferase-like glycosyltransferase